MNNDLTKDSFNKEEIKLFIKLIKNHKFECYYKLIMTYNLSVMELVNLEWKDIDFDNHTISIYKISRKKTNQIYYRWEMNKKEDFKRTYPLLISIKNLLLKLKEQQEYNASISNNYDYTNFVCLKDNGTRININTLSANLRRIARNNGLPGILLSGLKKSFHQFIYEKVGDIDMANAWLRVDYNANVPKHIYDEVNFKRDRKLAKEIDSLFDLKKSHKQDIEM